MTQDNTILEYLNIILNSISFFGGLIVLSILLILTLTNPQPMNRVSIRLTGFISFIDLLKALTILVYTYTTSKGIACSIIGFLLNYFTLLYLFSTVAIAVNLNLVVILGKEFKKEWEFWYWICPIFGALILAMLPFVGHRYGPEDSYGHCYFKDPGSTTTFLWNFFTSVIWILLSIIYCTVVVILTIQTLTKKINVIDGIVSSGSGTNSNRSSMSLVGSVSSSSSLVRSELREKMKTLIGRISLYCLIPFITQFGLCLYVFMELFYDDVPIAVNYLSCIGTSLPGLLNLIAFLLDPAFHTCLETFREKYYSKYPKTQPNSDPSDDPSDDWILPEHTVKLSLSHDNEATSTSSPVEFENIHLPIFLTPDLYSNTIQLEENTNTKSNNNPALLQLPTEPTSIMKPHFKDLDGTKGRSITYKKFIKGL